MHCWTDRKQHLIDTYGWGSAEHVATYADAWHDGSCMLEAEHAGEHEFTDDCEIGVAFVAREP